MTSKTSSNKYLSELKNTYLWASKKNLGMTSLLAVLLFLAFPLVVWFSLANTEMNIWIPAGEQYANVFRRTSFTSMTFFVTPLCLLFVLLTAVSLFQYMHNKRSVDLFHALPVGRSAMLLGRFLAGLTTLFVPLLINFSLVAVVGLSYGIENSGAHIGYLYSVLLWLFLMLAAALLFCVLMAVCSGTTLDMVLSVIGVNIAYPLLILAVLFVISCLLPGFNTEHVSPLLTTLISPFTAVFAAISSVDQAFDAEKITFLIWWIVFSVFLAVLCVYLYRRRKSESAENTFAFAIPKQIIRFLLTAVGGLGLGLIFYWYNSTTLNFLLGLLIGSLVAHIIVEAVYSRGFSRMVRSLGGYGVFLVVFAAFYGIVCTGGFGYADRVPSVDQVASVTYQDYSYYDSFTDWHFYITDEKYNTLAKAESHVVQPENIEKVLQYHQGLIDFKKSIGFPYRMERQNGTLCSITYHLKNGKTLTRTYWDVYRDSHSVGLPKELKDLSGEICNSREYKESGNMLFYLTPEIVTGVQIEDYTPEKETTSVSYKLAPEESEKLLEAMRQDVLDIDVTQVKGRYAETAESTEAAEVTRGDNVALSLVLGEKDTRLFTPKEGSKLKELIGAYSGKISLEQGQYQMSGMEDSHTWAFMKEQGWIK